jgi:hypothetical protein
MPHGNRFRHQTYTSTYPESPHYLMSPGDYPVFGSDEFRRRMRAVGQSLRSAGVAGVYLSHGTFVGSDALGMLSELARILPAAAEAVHRFVPLVVAKLTGEAGNYTAGYARLFESAINAPGQTRIPVRLFHWSSENHHLGRADGAVRLIDELASGDFQPGQRVLLWGHSHAGNLFALMSNLLAADHEAVERFFEATAIYYRWPVVGVIDIPVWNRVQALLHQERPLGPAALDVVTFGTPIRYGWDSDGYSRLLHFVHHRPSEGLPAYRAPFPPRLQRVMHAADGDYVQQLGIAGTNVCPSVFSWRAWLADRRLHRLLQKETSEASPLDRFQAGAIVPQEGTTLLVDYGRQHGSIAQHHAGHAVYTRKQWLLFHAEEVVRQFYSSRVSQVA